MGILNDRFYRYNEDLRKSKTKMFKSILDNVKYSFLENKTGFIIKRIEGKFSEKFVFNPSEKFVRNYFEKKGYNVFREINLKVTSIKHRVLIELLFCFFDFNQKKLDEFLHNLRNPGKPDFLIYNDHCFFFVEVKSDGGSRIQENQIQFLEYLSELKIPNFIFLVHNQEPLKQEIRK